MQGVERARLAVDGLNLPGDKVTQRVFLVGPGVFGFFILNPAFYLPPPPDYAVEGT